VLLYWCLSKLLIFNVTPRRSYYLSERTQPESVLVRPQSRCRFQQRKGQPGRTAKYTCLCQKTRNTGDVWLPGRSADPTPKSVLHQHFELSRSSQLPAAASFPKRAELCPERAGLLFSLPVLPGRSLGHPPIRQHEDKIGQRNIPRHFQFILLQPGEISRCRQLRHLQQTSKSRTVPCSSGRTQREKEGVWEARWKKCQRTSIQNEFLLSQK
jgi:hypothetical protein